jgi:hypothetical protein
MQEYASDNAHIEITISIFVKLVIDYGVKGESQKMIVLPYHPRFVKAERWRIRQMHKEGL